MAKYANPDEYFKSLFERGWKTGGRWWERFVSTRSACLEKKGELYDYSGTDHMVDHGWGHHIALFESLPRFLWSIETHSNIKLSKLFDSGAELYALVVSSLLHDIGNNILDKFEDFRNAVCQRKTEYCSEKAEEILVGKDITMGLIDPQIVRELHPEIGAWMCEKALFLTDEPERQTISQIIYRHAKRVSKDDAKEGKLKLNPSDSETVRIGFVASLLAVADACQLGKKRVTPDKHRYKLEAEKKKTQWSLRGIWWNPTLKKTLRSQLTMIGKQPEHIDKHSAIEEVSMGPGGFVVVPAVPAAMNVRAWFKTIGEGQKTSNGELIRKACEEMQEEVEQRLSGGKSVSEYLKGLFNTTIFPDIPIVDAESWMKEHKETVSQSNLLWQTYVSNSPPFAGGAWVEELKKNAKDITDNTINELKNKYLAELFLEPPAWNTRLNAFLEDPRPGLLLSAPAGAGKSSLLCKTSDELSTSYIVFFWHHLNLPSPIWDKLKREIKVSDVNEMQNVLEAMGARLALIVDGINEHERPEHAIREILTLAKMIGNDRKNLFKIIVSIRDIALQEYEDPHSNINLEAFKDYFFTVGQDKRGTSYEPISIPVEPFNDEQYVELVNKYRNRTGYEFCGDLLRLPKSTQQELRKPLMLRLLGEAFPQQQVPVDLSADFLIERYVDERTKRYGRAEAAALKDLLLWAAEMMYNNETVRLEKETFIHSLSAESSFKVNDWYAKLLDEGIIMEHTTRDKRTFGFTFEHFHEFLIGKYILSLRGKSEKEKLLEIGGKGERWSHVRNALKIYLRINLEKISDLVRKALEYAGKCGERAVGDLLGDFVTSRQTEKADLVESALQKCSPKSEVEVLKTAMENTFDTADQDRFQRLAGRCTRVQEELGDEIEAAGTLTLLADFYYNRADEYSKAIDALKKAVGKLDSRKSCGEDLTDKIYKTKYFLARVLMDGGFRKEAECIANELLSFYEKDTGNEYQRGLSHFLMYMIVGDASGYYKKGLEDHLKEAERIFMKLGDHPPNQRAIGRILINRAIAEMYTAGTQLAVKTVNEAISILTKLEDIQGKGYAFNCLASIYIREAVWAEGKEKENLLEKAEVALREAERIQPITGERYLLTQCLGNQANIYFLRANVHFLKNERDKALDLRNRALNHYSEISAEAEEDFFVWFDAEIMIHGELAPSKEQLLRLIDKAKEKNYIQGLVYIYGKLSELLGREGDSDHGEEYRKKELEIAKELGWGPDPREFYLIDWYSGIYI